MKKIKLLLCLLMLTSLCGCSSNDSSSKILNAAMFWISTSLDPTNNYDGWVLSRIGVGETLLKLNEKYEVASINNKNIIYAYHKFDIIP